MNRKKIEELVEKYFDGQTTCAEERALRRTFAKGKVPKHLEVYRPLFAYIDKEAESHAQVQGLRPTRRRRAIHRPRLVYWAGGLAAGLALCLALARFLPRTEEAENYVIINGERYTAPALVQAKAREALHNVGYTDEELSQLLFPCNPKP